jgi:hypothetical protein
VTVSPQGGPVVVPVTNTPMQLCPSLGKGSSIFILNTDDTANLFIGINAGITPQNSLIVPAGASIVQDASQTVWAFTDSLNPPLLAQLSPAVTQYNLSPEQVLTTIDIAALATAIAVAITTSGVPLLSAPVPMYSVTQSPGTPGMFGATFTSANWGSQGAADAAVTGFNTAVGRTATCMKLYYSQGQFPQTIGIPEQQAIDTDLKVYVCFKPTFSPAPKASDTTAMIATLQFLQSNGITIAGVIVGQEPEAWYNYHGGPTPAQYVALVQFHYPGLKTAGYRIGMDHDGSSQGQWASFDPGTGYQDFDLCDFYGPVWLNKGGTSGTVLSGIAALAASYGVGWGLGEYNTANDTSSLSSSDGTSYLQAINSQAVATLTGGGILEAFMWYQGDGNTGPPLTSTDYRVPLLQTIHDTVAASNQPSMLPSHTSVVVPPINPSMIDPNLAPANTISYDGLLVLTAGTGSTKPFVKVTVSWRYLLSNGGEYKMRSQQWIVPMGTEGTSGTFIDMLGPQHGQYVEIQLFNLDTVAATYQLQANATSRSQDLHDWRWDASSSVAVPGYTLAGGADGNTLYVTFSATIDTGDTSSWLMGMFAGQAYLNLKVNGAAGTNTVHFTLIPVPQSEFSAVEEFSAYLPAGSGITQNEAYYTFACPRGPMELTVVNNDANNVTVTAVLVPIEMG